MGFNKTHPLTVDDINTKYGPSNFLTYGSGANFPFPIFKKSYIFLCRKSTKFVWQQLHQSLKNSHENHPESEFFIVFRNDVLKCFTLFLNISEKFTSLKIGVIFVGVL